MQTKILPQGILLSRIKNFDLKKTLDCGQCFRFYQNKDGSWHGVAGNRPLTVHQTNDGVIFKNITKEEFDAFWRIYFDLDRDYDAISRAFPDSLYMRESTRFSSGMRVLRQDAWETLISFIISQNNNIPRIKGIIDRLCRNFGQQCGEDFGFPSPIVLADLNEHDLGILRCGWRSAYILDAAQRVASGEINLKEIAKMPINDARKALQIIKGVGPKVAECVLLYGMGRYDAFPLDVWMKRAMSELFPGLEPKSFGEYAGIAQQYIFHFSRCNPECFVK